MQASRKLAVWVGFSWVLATPGAGAASTLGQGGGGGAAESPGRSQVASPVEAEAHTQEAQTQEAQTQEVQTQEPRFEEAPTEQAPDDDPRGERIRSLRALDDGALAKHLEAQVEALATTYRTWELDATLSEILRRGGEGWAPLLEAQLDTVARHAAEGSHLNVPRNLELLTALRRLQGRADPLEIQVVIPEDERSLTFPALPTLSVAVRNLDERPVGFQVGGDYRSGRSSRWNIVAFDSEGDRLPGLDPWLGMGGGLSTRQLLDEGDTWEIELPMSSYATPEGAGQTTFEVHYHDAWPIADDPDPRGWITSKSERFEFTWTPLTVPVTSSLWEALQADVAELATAGTPYLLRSKYGEDDHADLQPESAPGRLLSRDKTSLPALFEALEYQTLSFEERAWVLCLLHGITGLHNPFHVPGSLGTFRAQGGREYSRDRNPEAQQGLVDRWLGLRDCVLIKLP